MKITNTEKIKRLKEILYISEITSLKEDTKWVISFRKPEFQGGESEVISKEEAQMILGLLKENH